MCLSGAANTQPQPTDQFNRTSQRPLIKIAFGATMGDNSVRSTCSHPFPTRLSTPEAPAMRHFCLCLFVLPLLAANAAAAEKSTPSAPLTFEAHIRPILKAHCFHCHGEEEKHEGKLDVRLTRLLVKGGESGAAIVPGKA